MSLKNISIIVPGSLNTDIIGLGVPEIITKGELSFGGQLKIGPGGKSRNIAQMISVLIGNDKVAMIGKTSKDPFGLWKPPIDALNKSGVNTKFVKILAFKKTKKYPGIALIPVDRNGNNQIYVLPGINENFTQQDLDNSRVLFKNAGKNKGILVLSLELPLKTAIRALELGNEYNLKSVLDPGGIIKDVNYDELLNNIFLIKPNEHEAKILTGIDVMDFASAKKSAQILLNKGIQNVLITAGKNGAYFFNNNYEKHFKIPEVATSTTKDETGCGDQTIATLCAYLSKGTEIIQSVEYAIISGTMQFYKEGIQPITVNELSKYKKIKN